METVVILAGGPSLTRADVALCEQAGYPLLGINNAYQISDRLTYLYACDAKWWNKHYEHVNGCRKFSLEETPYADVEKMENDGADGVSHEWPKLRTGGNSGYQAINLAYLLGYKKIVLLGYDMQETNGQTHWHGLHKGLNNPNHQQFSTWRASFALLAWELKKAGVRVVNATRQTALTCFKQMSVGKAL